MILDVIKLDSCIESRYVKLDFNFVLKAQKMRHALTFLCNLK